MHRLLPLPVTAEPYTPPLEVYLKGDDPHLGLRRPLHIHSISAILGERSHVLLLPDRTVDVEFQRQTLYQIYNARRANFLKECVWAEADFASHCIHISA
jgi:hypothetical protein